MNVPQVKYITTKQVNITLMLMSSSLNKDILNNVNFGLKVT